MIEIKNFSKQYPKSAKKAVDNLTLTVDSGDIFGFIGHNGAGKTTTIKAIAGIMDFSDGDIVINGISVKDNPIACKKDMAYVPDSPDVYPSLTGIQYLKFISDIYEIPKAQRQDRIKKYSDMLEITDRLGDIISGYSHGMKQKVTLVGALIRNPKVMLLDEPFVGLDPKASHTLKKVIAEMCENGCSVFFSTHILEVAEKFCNKIAIIKDGKLIASGTTQEVRGNSTLEDVFLELYDDE